MSYILDGIKTAEGFAELIAKSNGENVKVNYNGKEMTLAAALAEIFTSVSGVISASDVDEKIGTAIMLLGLILTVKFTAAHIPLVALTIQNFLNGTMLTPKTKTGADILLPLTGIR